MKKMLMFVYNYLLTDARVQRSATVLTDEYDLEVIALSDGFKDDNYKIITLNIKSRISFIRYFRFVIGVVKYGLDKKYDYIYAHDLYTALPALLLRLLRVGKKYIYDAHETIFPQENVKFSKRDYFFYFFERAYIKCADLIICAQQMRGILMKEHYSLSTVPIVIQNISILTKSAEILSDDIRQQLNKFFCQKGKTIVYAGGINADRRIGALIEVAHSLGDKCKVLLIGDGNEVQILKQIVKEKKISNCTFISKIPYKNLAEVVERCDIGYVSYPMTDINNIYCASNKIFEYASVNLPMIATYNVTIESDLHKWKIGECSDNLNDIANKVIDNIEYYRSNIQAFNDNNNWENETKKLLDAIQNLDTIKK